MKRRIIVEWASIFLLMKIAFRDARHISSSNHISLSYLFDQSHFPSDYISIGIYQHPKSYEISQASSNSFQIIPREFSRYGDDPRMYERPNPSQIRSLDPDPVTRSGLPSIFLFQICRDINRRTGVIAGRSPKILQTQSPVSFGYLRLDRDEQR